LSDLVKPLLIGNITTVAAFLTLVPLEAVAIRQLGLFSALMLVGTILFVLLVLPHFGMKRFGRRLAPEQNDKPAATWMDRFVKHPLVLSAILILTLVLGWQSLGMTFDSDVSHLNYMTAGQRADMKRLEAMQGPTQGVVVYVTATAEQMEAVRPLSDSLLSAGLVTDEAVRQRTVAEVVSALESEGFQVTGCIESPIHGKKKGNIEYLVRAVMQNC
jgi:predicted exporter